VSDAPERIHASPRPVRTFDSEQRIGTVEYVRADLYAALEQERDELDAHLMETLDQLDNCKLGYIDCLKSRSFELRRLEQEVERLRTAYKMFEGRHGYDAALTKPKGE